MMRKAQKEMVMSSVEARTPSLFPHISSSKNQIKLQPSSILNSSLQEHHACLSPSCTIEELYLLIYLFLTDFCMGTLPSS